MNPKVKKTFNELKEIGVPVFDIEFNTFFIIIVDPEENEEIWWAWYDNMRKITESNNMYFMWDSGYKILVIEKRP